MFAVCAACNGADGISDIEGKVTRVGASECGQRGSFNRDRDLANEPNWWKRLVNRRQIKNAPMVREHRAKPRVRSVPAREDRKRESQELDRAREAGCLRSNSSRRRY